MTVFSALLLAGVLSALALAVGGAVGMRLTSRVVEQRQRVATEWSGITVSQMLQCIVTLMPLGAAGGDATAGPNAGATHLLPVGAAPFRCPDHGVG